MVSIFDISEGNIVVNQNCLLIPELKAIVDTYENYIPVLGYVHFTCDPKSPYANLPDNEREEMILADYVADYSVDDEVVYKAVEKIKKLYETPSMRFLRDARGGLENLSQYLSKASVTEGKDSNLTGLISALKSISKINQEYKALEKDVEEELRVRGQNLTGYDEI